MSLLYVEGIEEDLDTPGFWMGPVDSNGIVTCENCQSTIRLDITTCFQIRVMKTPPKNKELLEGAEEVVSFAWNCICNEFIEVVIEVDIVHLPTEDNGKEDKPEGKKKRRRTKFRGPRKVIPFPINRIVRK